MRASETDLNKKELFARVRGYYLSYSDMKTPQVVNTWNVLKLLLPRNQRHHDVNEMSKFWQDLEMFLKRERFKCDW